MFQGTVQKTFTNVVRGRNLYSFTLKGTQGFFRTGEKPVPAKEGNFVQFEADDKNNVSMDTFCVVEKREPDIIPNGVTEAPGIKGLASKAYQLSSPFTKDEYWRNKEERDIETQKTIQYQAARNSAIAAMDVAVSQGIVELPKTKGKSYDAFLAYIDHLTDRFFADAKVQKHEVPSPDAPEPFVKAESAGPSDRE